MAARAPANPDFWTAPAVEEPAEKGEDGQRGR
jgi:hypothetical protein